jgi:arylsulfatase A-like enzyme
MHHALPALAILCTVALAAGAADPASAKRPNIAALSSSRRFRGAGREALPLQRADERRHLGARRSRLVGDRRQPAGIDRLEEEPSIFTLTPGQFGGTLSWYASPAPDGKHTDGLIAREAERLLERCAADRPRPFFLAVGFFRPHTPFVAPKDPWFGMHPEVEMPVVTGVAEDQADLPPAALASRSAAEAHLTDDLRRQCRQASCASISFLDAQVGRVVAALDRLGLADETVIVFTSDHGYHMGEHGLWQKQSLFEESCRVPLLIVSPGVSRPGLGHHAGGR